ncbi:MAG: NUDIX domain-containing protein [Anaerolineales bacterium]|jgi:ADP-ribose pyrophosphatase YjhB (NUDIX family)
MDRLMVALYRRLWLPIRIKQKLIWLLNPKFCVGVLAFIPHPQHPGQVLVADHSYRGEISWSLPGGLVRKHEHPQAAVQREVEEELGLEVMVEALLHAAPSEFGISLDLVYLCRLVENQPTFHLSGEVRGVKFYEWDRLPIKHMYPQHAALIQQLAQQYRRREF